MAVSTLPQIDSTQLSDGPPEEEFWDRYNKRLEFPLSTVATVLLHALIAALLLLVLGYLMNSSPRFSRKDGAMRAFSMRSTKNSNIETATRPSTCTSRWCKPAGP